MPILRLDHVQISAPKGEEAAARRFYGDLLGLTEIPKPHTLQGRGGVWYQVGEHQIHLGMEDPQPNAASRRHVALLVDDLDQFRAHLEAHGVATSEDLPLPGYRRCYARDPFGNRVEFMERVAE